MQPPEPELKKKIREAAEQEDAEHDGDETEPFFDELADRWSQPPQQRRDHEEPEPAGKHRGDGEHGEVELGHPAGDGDDLVGKRREAGDEDDPRAPLVIAPLELGKAVRTIFVCVYLRSETLRREIHEGLNIIELWNDVNDFILFGKGGEFATNRRESQELTVLSLHLLQNCMVYINTLMIQQVLSEPKMLKTLTPEDYRALTPLI